ncbi:MAG: sensor domain-containing diguanylate cyclase [Pseudomonadota bacterium]
MREISVNRNAAELHQMLNYLGVPAFVIDVVAANEFRLAAINSRHEQLTGLKHGDVAGRSVDDLLSPEMAATVKANYRRCVESKAATDYQEVLDLPVGRTFWQTSLVPFFDEAGEVSRLLGTAYEISAQTHLELETRYQSTVMSAYLDESPDGILVVDASNRIKTWNRRFLEIWDIPETVMEARDGEAALRTVIPLLEDPVGFVQRVQELYASLHEEEHGVRVNMKDGRVLERYSRGLHGPEGDYWGRIWFYRDVTELQRLTDELLRMARSDPLTGTANRRVLMEVLEEEFSRARRYGHQLSVLMLDLDHFKQVNDRHGHATGDAVLKELVRVVTPEIRGSDCFARLGGEEFAILLPENDLDSARQLAERLCRAVALLTFRSTQGEFGVTVSIGVATLRDSDMSPEHLLNRADQCLYAAKSGGRNQVHCGHGENRGEPKLEA